MGRMDALLEDYGSYHRTRGNLVCHAFGITLILYGTTTLLQRALLRGSRAFEPHRSHRVTSAGAAPVAANIMRAAARRRPTDGPDGRASRRLRLLSPHPRQPRLPRLRDHAHPLRDHRSAP